MITASLGSHRFESGPTYHFNGSNFGELINTIDDPDSTVNYVNTLKGVDATPQEIREVAASGVVSLAVGGSDFRLIELAGDLLVGVNSGEYTVADEFTRTPSGEDVFYGRGLANYIWDSASVLATRKNKVDEVAGLICEAAPTDEGYFIIGLANGGIISAARTFQGLGEGNHKLGFVRYSMHKAKQTEPHMYPYPEQRAGWLESLAEGRKVVVLDEDYATEKTLSTATRFFANLLDTEVLGVAPVRVDRHIEFNPLVIKSTEV